MKAWQKTLKAGLWFGLLAGVGLVARADAHFKLLKYNTEGSDFLKGGLIAHSVVPVDVDGDGRLDLQVAFWGASDMSGTWYFRNISQPGGKTLFASRERNQHLMAGLLCRLADGTSAVVAENQVNYDYIKNPISGFQSLGVSTNNVHWGDIRANYWRLVDFDGDGRDDIVIGVGDWREYGWHNNYTSSGLWKTAQIHGLIYLIRNEGGARGQEKWGEPELVRIENGDPIEVYGNCSPMFEDWDGDGDLDVISGDFRENWIFFENLGTRKSPVYTSGRLLHATDGKRLRSEHGITAPAAVDWDGDGKMDFLAGDEDGRVGYYRNSGRVKQGMPLFEHPVYFRSQRDFVCFGVFTAPWVVDWDGDGDQDILLGNSAGQLAWVENLSGTGVAEPQWDAPKLLSCEEPERGWRSPFIPQLKGTYPMVEFSPFHLRAGPNGSIQGPCESFFGYTIPSAADWDGDGDLDIMLNNTWGKILLLRNVGTRTQPKLAAPEGVEVEWEGAQPRLGWGWLTPERMENPREILTQWRTTPVMFDMNGDGLMDLVLMDTEGYLAYFERARQADGKLVLKAPKRALVDADTGRPLLVSGWTGDGRGVAGDAGRRKVCLADWDGDGKVDLIMNSAFVGGNAAYWRQVGMTNGVWRFKKVVDKLTEDRLEWHCTAPAACDFDGDGITDLLMGAEDGFVYYLQNPRGKHK